MSERDDIREHRRTESCGPKVGVPRLADKKSPRRTKNDCDPEVVIPPDKLSDPPDKLSDPTGVTTDVVASNGNPANLVINNNTPSVTCADLDGSPPYGGPTVPLSGIETERHLDWNDVPNITDTQLDYISILNAVNLAPVLTGTAETIRDVTRLGLTQSEWVRDEVDRLQEAADDGATALALSYLDCYWINTEQIAQCPAGALTSWDPGTIPVPNNPSTVVTSTIQSRISQEDADSRALSQAESHLSCVWGNDQVDVSCEELDLGHGGGVVTYTVPPNTIFSGSGQSDANDQAHALALLQLECLYYSEAINDRCVALDITGPELDQLMHPLGSANLDTNVSGTDISIPYGYFKSSFSQDDADTQAVNLKNSLMICRWGSAYIPRPCSTTFEVETGSLAYLFGNAPTVDLLLSDTLSSNLHTPSDTFTSSVSAADADDMAEAYAQASSLCVYCNPDVPAFCSPPAVEINSSDETLGLPAHSVCSTDTDSILNQSTQLAVIPASSKTEKECRWPNEEIKLTCEDYATSINEEPINLTDDTIARYVVIPAGTFSSDVSQADANLLAEGYATAALLCKFTAFGYAECIPMPDLRPFTIFNRANGQPGLFEPPESLIPGSAPGQVAVWIDDPDLNTVTTIPPSIVVPRGIIIADGYITAKALADDLALTQLNCDHTNWTRNLAECPKSDDILQVEGFVAAGQFQDVSTEAANIQAELAALALTECTECQPFALAPVPSEVNATAEVHICEGAVQAWRGGGGGELCVPCMRDLEDGQLVSMDSQTISATSGMNFFWIRLRCVEDQPVLDIVHSTTEDAYEDGCDGNEQFFYSAGSVEVKQEFSGGQLRTVTQVKQVATSNQVFASNPRPFQGTVNGANIAVSSGFVISREGAGPSVSRYIKFLENSVAIAGTNGSVWLKADLNKEILGTIHLQGNSINTIRLYAIGGCAISTTKPVDGERWSTEGEWLLEERHYWRLFDYDTVGGKVVITNEYVISNLFYHEIYIMAVGSSSDDE